MREFSAKMRIGTHKIGAENIKLNRKDDIEMTVTKDTIIGDVLDFNRDTAPFFFEMGMHCLGCALAHGETVGEAADVHGADLQKMLEELNYSE